MTDATEDEGTWNRLTRRKVVQWGIAYAAGAWGFLQGLQYVSEAFGWPGQLRQVAILASIGRKSAGTFMLPGLLKITVSSVPAKPARKGINPFTGEPTTFKAKPATVKVKVRPMKKLKDAASA